MLTLAFYRFFRFYIFFFSIFYVGNIFANDGRISMRPSLLDELVESSSSAELKGVKEVVSAEEDKSVKKINEAKDSGKVRSIFKNYINYNSGNKSSALKVASLVKEDQPVKIESNSIFDLKKLPRRYNHWLLDVVKPSHFGGRRCVLRSNMTEMEDGYAQTPVVLEVFSDLIKVSGQSPIDLSYNGLGIKVDSYDRVSIDAIVSETNALFFLDLATLISQMSNGDKLDVALGFLSVTPLDQSFSAEISLRGFSNGIKKLSECEETLSRASL